MPGQHIEQSTIPPSKVLLNPLLTITFPTNPITLTSEIGTKSSNNQTNYFMTLSQLDRLYGVKTEDHCDR